MTSKQWDKIKVGRIIYSANTGRPRRVLRVSSSKCVALSPCGGVGGAIVYCKGDKAFFRLSRKPV